MTVSDSKIRVLLVDDHAIVIEGLRALLNNEHDIEVVAATRDAGQVARLVQQSKPDVVLLDIELGSVRGTDVLHELRAHAPLPKVLALTAYNDGETIRSVLDAGADGLSFKTEPPERTIAAIREVHLGQLVFPASARRWLVREKNRPASDLTPREHDVWELVAAGLSNRQIAQRLKIGENTVKYHLQHLFLKLGVNNRTEAALKFADVSRSRPR